MSQYLTREDITRGVESVIDAHIGEDSRVSPETHLQDDLEVDSLERVELGIKLEKALGIVLPNATMRKSETVEDIIEAFWQAKQNEEEAKRS